MRDYSSAVSLLNSLQSNAAVIESLRVSGQALNLLSLPQMRDIVAKVGVIIPKQVIHIAGTKGKGSTACYTESILRQSTMHSPGSGSDSLGSGSSSGSNGSEGERRLRTGLYTSPHLQQVRERIRINGKPLSQSQFTHYFYSLWDRFDGERPSYFRYLTLLSFLAFEQEKVDCVILEVGIGGEYDATNIVNPIVCGISSLGHDHVDLLGGSIETIAWHKAGIMKENIPVFSVPQLDVTIPVLKQRSLERKAPLTFISDSEIESINLGDIGLKGDHQRTNAALAVQLSKTFIQSNPDYSLTPQGIQKGLKEAFWPGRAQIIDWQGSNWYIDGAHTPESLKACASWYQSESLNYNGSHILIFNCTNGRSPVNILPPLIQLFSQFSNPKIIFCTNEAYRLDNPLRNSHCDLTNHTVYQDPTFKAQKGLERTWIELGGNGSVSVVGTIEEAVELANESKARVLVTGSLHLLGGFLTVIEHPVQ